MSTVLGLNKLLHMQVQELLLCVDTWPASLDHRSRAVSPSSRALSNLNESLRISWQDFIRSDLLLDSQACRSKKKKTLLCCTTARYLYPAYRPEAHHACGDRESSRMS